MSKDLYPWQKQMIVDIESYNSNTGWKAGEMSIMMAGRSTGKSVMTNYAAFKRMFEDIFADRPITDLVLTESRVHGSRYYCVQPEGGSWKDMEAWCRETFGEPGEIWPSQDFVWPEVPRWMQNNRKFWFRSEKDRNWFVMRWRA